MHDTDNEEYAPTKRSGRLIETNNGPDVPRPRRESNPRSQTEKQVIGAYLAAGHAVTVITPEWKRAVVNACRYCKTEIPTAWEETPCEFPSQPFKGCKCNGCLEREGKLKRRAGRAREVCGSDVCRKAHQRDRQRDARAKKKAAALAA
jgi:hypothetical protein